MYKVVNLIHLCSSSSLFTCC